MLDFIFPRFCLHCHDLLHSKEKILCIKCQKLLTYIDVQNRCRHCFLPLGCNCRYHLYPLHSIRSAFEYENVAKSMVKQLKYRGSYYLAKSMGALMARFYIEQESKMPDLVTSIPMPVLRYLSRGYNQSELLAKEVAKILQRPFASLLKASLYTPPKAAMNRLERKEENYFYTLKNNKLSIENKVILIIDDVATSGNTLRAAALSLKELDPKQVLSLTFCRTDYQIPLSS